MDVRSQLRSVIEWVDPSPDLLFERWTQNGDEIKSASKLIVGPGQGCLFLYEGRLEATFTKEGVYELETDNVPFWTSIKNALYNFESHHKVGIYFFRAAGILNRRWGTPSPITYLDPQYRFPVGLGAFGNYSLQISRPEEFFRKVVAGAHVYTAQEIQRVILSRIGEPIATYLANSQFSYIEIDKHRSEIAAHVKAQVVGIFSELGFALLDFRIEGTSFDAATQERIGKISDMTAEAQGIRSLGVDYAQYQQLQAIRDLARNPSGGNAGLQVGLGLEAIKAATHDDPTEKLGKLKKLFDAGLIDEAEYKAKKQEILSKL